NDQSIGDAGEGGQEEQLVGRDLHFASNEPNQIHNALLSRKRFAEAVMSPGRSSAIRAGLAAHYLPRSLLAKPLEGAVSRRTTTATRGVTSSEAKKVPKNPSRRLIPQNPTRMQRMT